MLAIALGGRDVALALGTLRALSAGHGAGPWLRAGIVADLADLVATLRARDRLPPIAVPAVALAGGSILLGAWLQAAADERRDGGSASPCRRASRDQIVCSVRATTARSPAGSRPSESVR